MEDRLETLHQILNRDNEIRTFRAGAQKMLIFLPIMSLYPTQSSSPSRCDIEERPKLLTL